MKNYGYHGYACRRHCERNYPVHCRSRGANNRSRNRMAEIQRLINLAWHRDGCSCTRLFFYKYRTLYVKPFQKDFLNNKIPEQKTDYLFEGVEPQSNIMKFGFFFTELSIIREITGMSYQVLFTGCATSST